MRVTVKGSPEIHKAFAHLIDPELTKEIDAANRKQAQAIAKELRTAARPVSKRMARAVRVKRAKSGKPSWVVGSKRKIAFFWPFVIGGTRAHGPRRAPALAFEVGGRFVHARRVRGVPANPIVDRVIQGREAAAARDLEADIVQRTGL